MMYRVTFNALNTRLTVQASFEMDVGPFNPENPNEPRLAVGDLRLQRLCVEYARLRGVRCSYADIKSIDEVAA